MKKVCRRAALRALTLIELLCVIAIIAILAALLLPALTRGKQSAKRIQCVGNLHQAGLGFHSFSHDHGDRFPMAVPGSAGGSMEFVQNAYRVAGEFYFAFRHFQALSNEMVTPKIVLCPADTRLPAPNFGLLQNENLSYFIAVNADFSRPHAILAGDRNIAGDWLGHATILQAGAGNLRWTGELHRFKGNLHFADGRVEMQNQSLLLAAQQQIPTKTELFLPTVRPPAVTQSANAAPWTGTVWLATAAQAGRGPCIAVLARSGTEPIRLPAGDDTIRKLSEKAPAHSPRNPSPSNSELASPLEPSGLWLFGLSLKLEGKLWLWLLLLLLLGALVAVEPRRGNKRKGITH